MQDKRIIKILQENVDFKLIAPNFENDKIGASYLFVSADEILAQSFLELCLQKFYCKNLKGDMPCLECENCIKIKNRTHLDVVYFGKGESLIKKEEIKYLLESAITKPFESEHKFLIIEKGENLSEITQNLLLKTIEDLPSFVTVIIFTKSISKILPTIKSRCQTYILKPLPKQSLIALLGSTEKSLHMVDVSDGILSKAIQYHEASNVFEDRYKFGISMLNAFSSSADMLKYVAYLNKNKEHLKDIFEIVQGVFYQALKGKIACTTDEKALAKIVRLCNDCCDLMEKNILTNIVIDKFLLGVLKIKLNRS